MLRYRNLAVPASNTRLAQPLTTIHKQIRTTQSPFLFGCRCFFSTLLTQPRSGTRARRLPARNNGLCCKKATAVVTAAPKMGAPLTVGKGSTHRTVKGHLLGHAPLQSTDVAGATHVPMSNSTTSKLALTGCRGLCAHDVCKANAPRNARKRIHKSIPQRVGHG